MEKIIYFFALLVGCALAVPLDGVEKSLSSRLSNGIPSPENYFPYAVSLQSSDAVSQVLPTRGHRCGGVLVTLQHILTTATCLFDFYANGTIAAINPASYQVFAGSVNLANTTADRIRPIANFTIHPDYHLPPAHLNDIAIITLTVPFANTTAVPLALPSASWMPADFAVCTVAGWGATAAGAGATQTSPTLQYVNKYIYNQGLCTSLYSTLTGVPNIFPNMVCAASYDILSTGCTGDGGNALVCNGILTGLLFHHNSCVSTSYPELYTRVSNHTQWVRSITGAGATFTPTNFPILFFMFTQMIFVKVIS